MAGSRSSDAAREELVGSDLLLLLMSAPTEVDSADDQIQGITRLEKLLFLGDAQSSELGQVQEPLKFEAYDYGPYSKDVYEAVETLEEAGLVREERVLGARTLDEMEELEAALSEREGVERRFFLTKEGKAVAEYLGRQYPKLVELFSQIKNQYASMPLRQLIRYVYAQFPEMAAKSRIRDRL